MATRLVAGMQRLLYVLMHTYRDGIHYDYGDPLMEKSGTSSNAWIHGDYGDPIVNHDDDWDYCSGGCGSDGKMAGWGQRTRL